MLVIRLSRAGTKNRPFYHVVVSESARTPTSRVTDRLGYYDPLRKPKVVQIDVGKADEWIRKGAHPSDTVRTLIEQARTAPASSAPAEVASPDAAPTDTAPTDAAPTGTAPAQA